MRGPIHEHTPLLLAQAAEWARLPALNPVLRPVDVDLGQDRARPDGRAALDEAQLLDRQDRLVGWLLDQMAPLTIAATWEYIADFRIRDHKYTALTATTGSGAAFAVRDRDLGAAADIVRHRDIGTGEMVDVLIDLLDLQPGSGSRMSVRVEDARNRNTAVTERALSPQHQQIRTVLNRPAAGPAIEITVGRRDSPGTYASCPHPLHIAILDWGAFLTYTTGDGGDEVFHCAPASAEYLRRALRDIRAQVPEPS